MLLEGTWAAPNRWMTQTPGLGSADAIVGLADAMPGGRGPSGGVYALLTGCGPYLTHSLRPAEFHASQAVKEQRWVAGGNGR
ncbi:hypothetical protein SSP35_03_04620 [Streptomyces sp. NBRC 110611]|nr:hypothetical protein SSP35_03_04620 [Streptomyces sp. NBRC 110611]